MLFEANRKNSENSQASGLNKSPVLPGFKSAPNRAHRDPIRGGEG